MKLYPYLTPSTKISSKWIKNLNLRPNTIKFLEENIPQKPPIRFGNDFFDYDTKDTGDKRKNWQTYENLKFYALKNTIHGVKRQPTEWKKIFENHLPDKGLMPRIYRELLKLKNKKPN